MTKQLDPLELLALSKIDAKAAREQATEGAHQVDVRVHVHGSLWIAGDCEQRPRVATDELYQLLAAAVANLKRGMTLELLVKRAFGLGQGLVDAEAVKAQVQALLLAGREPTKCRGQVRATLEAVRLV